MSPGKLVLTSLEDALKTLEDILQKPKDDIVRDATIQRFEYTYELARKMIRRHLDWAGVSGPMDLTKNELYREAVKAGLIKDAEDSAAATRPEFSAEIWSDWEIEKREQFESR